MLITWMIPAWMLEADSMRSRGSLLQGRMAFSFHRFRQPGQGVCDCTVHLHRPDGHGCDPGSQQYNPRIIWRPLNGIGVTAAIGYPTRCLLLLGLELWTK